MDRRDAGARARREYDVYAADYDRETAWYERVMLGDGRAWACSQARGDVLEVAVGTGRNLPHYPPDIRLSGVDLSRGMLERARSRAAASGVSVDLVIGDAQELPFAGEVFDTVVCTLGFSSIPDDFAAAAEIHRVLRERGRLVLLGHVAGRHRAVRALQHAVERAAARAERPTDRQTRRVDPPLRRAGFDVLYRSRSRGGAVERLTAAKLPRR